MEAPRNSFSSSAVAAIKDALDIAYKHKGKIQILGQTGKRNDPSTKTYTYWCDTFTVGRDMKLEATNTVKTYTIYCKTFFSLGDIHLKNLKVVAERIIASGSLEGTNALDLTATEHLLLINCKTSWGKVGRFMPADQKSITLSVTFTPTYYCVSCTKHYAQYSLPREQLPPVDAAIDYLLQKVICVQTETTPIFAKDEEVKLMGCYKTSSKELIMHYFKNVILNDSICAVRDYPCGSYLGPGPDTNTRDLENGFRKPQRLHVHEDGFCWTGYYGELDKTTETQRDWLRNSG